MKNWKRFGRIMKLLLIVGCAMAATAQAAQASTFLNRDGVCFSAAIRYELAETQRDAALEQAIKAEMGISQNDGAVSYWYNRIDLNGDGIPETFVYLAGRSVSGSGGDSALLFAQRAGDYVLLSRFTLVRSPILVSDERSNGWNNLVLRVSGGGIAPFFAELKYNGTSYPTNPSTQPAVEAGRVLNGTAIIADDLRQNGGFVLH